MGFIQISNLFIPLYIFHTLISGRLCTCGNTIDIKVLKAGEELWRETLPLQTGSRLYQLRGLKSYTWYEVKISYPACIPASFSLELKRDKTDLALHTNRRLLNTEKIIFRTESLDSSNQDGMYVLVTVEPEGFVAKPNVAERESILFNLVCDELLLGIPYKAWWVVFFVVLCLGLGFFIPSFLPPYLLQKHRSQQSFGQSASKDS
ncbi:GPI-Mannosyltransferase II co-activator, Pga [Trema orientale]|uniref:GPI-Mannosyltransferase II co-activator, Pga n=1 Tax=Trema orientale TaxID=63057 RepID=A0A2P5FL56_TREOI|nr:GPI-Mannosyltransferase II co-activator, Pga [Trema orientale]